MPVITLTNNDRLLDCVLVHKVVIMSCLLRVILILFSIVVILVAMHILYQSWEFLKKYFPGWRKRKSFWVKQDALYAQVKICRAWRQRYSFLECALRLMRRRLSCVVGSTKSRWSEMRSRKLEIFFLRRIAKHKISGFLSEIQSLWHDLKRWLQENSPEISFRLFLWLFLALREIIRVFLPAVLWGVLSAFTFSFTTGFTAALWLLSAFLHAVYLFTVLLVAPLLITTAVVFFSTIAIFLLLFFSMHSLIVAWFSNLVLGFRIIALGFKNVIFRLFQLVFGYSISKGIQPKEFLTFAISLVAVMLSFIGVTATLDSKPPSQNIFNTYNRVSNGSTVETDLKGLQNAINGLKTQIETIRGGPIQVKVESPTLQKELEDLQDAVNELGTQIEAIPKPPSSVELKGLQASLDGLKKQIEALRKVPIQVESSGLQKELKNLQEAVNGLKKQIGESQTADRAELQNLQNLQDAISDLKMQIKTMSKEELECLRKELAALNAQLKQPIVYKPWVIAKLVKGMARLLGIGDRKQQNGRQQSLPCPA